MAFLGLKRLGLIALLACVLTTGPLATNSAHASIVCYYDRTARQTVCRGSTGGSDGSDVQQVGTGPSAFRWEATRAVGPCPDDEVYYMIRMYRVSTGALVSEQDLCLAPGDTLSPPPPPPTPSQVVVGFDTLGALRPELLPEPVGSSAVDEPWSGAPVQFESWGWCVPPDDPVVDISVGPWRARAEMHIVRLKWVVSGPEPYAVESNDCGAPQVPSSTGAGAPFRWTPHTTGSYTIELTAVWTGNATYFYRGQNVGEVHLGEHPYSETVTQRIYEIEVLNG